MDCFKLNNVIHEFHDGISRNLYKQYVLSMNHLSNVAGALNDGLITLEEIDESCRPHIQIMAEMGQLNEKE